MENLKNLNTMFIIFKNLDYFVKILKIGFIENILILCIFMELDQASI